jgi:hypothetical protein
MRKGRRIDAERQFELAKRTFYSNGFWRRPHIPQPYRAWIDDLVTEQQEEVYRRYTFEQRDTEAARRTLAASQEEQRGFVLAAAK